MSFPIQVLLFLLGAAALAVIPLSSYGTPEIAIAAGAGAVVSAVNALFGYLAIVYAMNRSYSTFLKVVLGGMALRLTFMLGALAMLIGVLHLHAVALLSTMLVFYAVYLILEILFIQRHTIFQNHE
jgi:hypothetical protein